MTGERQAELTTVQNLRSIFKLFKCRDLGEAYVVRDHLSVMANARLDEDEDEDEDEEHALLALQALLRAAYGMALANDLPVGDVVSYAAMWRDKLAALRRLAARWKEVAEEEPPRVPSPARVKFTLDRYPFEFLDDAIAAAKALSSQQGARLQDLPHTLLQNLPSIRERSKEYRLLFYRQPSSDDIAAAARSAEIYPQTNRNEALRVLLIRGRKYSKHRIVLDAKLEASLKHEAFFASRTRLIKMDGLDVDATLEAVREAPSEELVGSARVIYDVLMRDAP
jgi:hypothetical protein